MKTPSRKNLKYAMGAYGLLALAAIFTLDRELMWFVLLLLGVFALKSWIAVRREELK